MVYPGYLQVGWLVDFINGLKVARLIYDQRLRVAIVFVQKYLGENKHARV